MRVAVPAAYALRVVSGPPRPLRSKILALVGAILFAGSTPVESRQPRVLVTDGTRATDGVTVADFRLLRGTSPGRVVFEARCIDGDCNRSGIYAFTRGRVRPVLRIGDVPEDSPPVTGIEVAIVSGRHVVASVVFADETVGLVLVDRRRLRTLVRSGDRAVTGEAIVPVGAFDVDAVFGIRGDDLIFAGRVAEQSYGFYVRDERLGIRPLVPDGLLPTRDGRLGFVDGVATSGTVTALRAEDEYGDVVLFDLTDAVSRRIAITGELAPGYTDERFGAMTLPIARDERVAFQAGLQEGTRNIQGVWLWQHGILRHLADSSESGAFYSGEFALTRSGLVAVAGERTDRLVYWEGRQKPRVLARGGDRFPGGRTIEAMFTVSATEKAAVFVAAVNDPHSIVAIMAVPLRSAAVTTAGSQ